MYKPFTTEQLAQLQAGLEAQIHRGKPRVPFTQPEALDLLEQCHRANILAKAVKPFIKDESVLKAYLHYLGDPDPETRA